VSKTSLTVTVLTRNESAIIARCLSSVRWADEIIVLDSHSTDDTVEIARRHGARVHLQNWLGWVPQHQRAIELASHDWILVLDADEIVTPELANSILATLRSNPDERDGYVIDRRDELFGRMLPNMRRASKRLSFVRLFNRRSSHYDPRETIHETIVCPGQMHLLEGILLHWRNVKFTEQAHKYVDNARLEADVLQARGVDVGFHHLLFRPLLRFLWCYVWCGGYRVGMVGLMQALMRANSEYLRYATLWERQHAKPALHPPPTVWKSSDMPGSTLSSATES
jgi:glycosyltransferase involved in cell wall biosynthesis